MDPHYVQGQQPGFLKANSRGTRSYASGGCLRWSLWRLALAGRSAREALPGEAKGFPLARSCFSPLFERKGKDGKGWKEAKGLQEGPSTDANERNPSKKWQHAAAAAVWNGLETTLQSKTVFYFHDKSIQKVNQDDTKTYPRESVFRSHSPKLVPFWAFWSPAELMRRHDHPQKRPMKTSCTQVFKKCWPFMFQPKIEKKKCFPEKLLKSSLTRKEKTKKNSLQNIQTG